jgi:hypothetical protein
MGLNGFRKATDCSGEKSVLILNYTKPAWNPQSLIFFANAQKPGYEALLQELAAFFVNLKRFASWRALVARLFADIEQVVISHNDFTNVRLDCSCRCK